MTARPVNVEKTGWSPPSFQQHALRDRVSVFNYAPVNKLAVCIVASFIATAPQLSMAGDCNDVVLEQVRKMPKGGRYSVSHFAKIRLQSSAHFESGKFFIIPAGPSFCSGATYLVFIRTIEALRERGQLNLDYATLERLIIRDQHDGEGVWGRWNANGPGTARLFHELRLGRNFDNIDQARPGDFMKIFWSRQVGRNEHGHSTIFLGTENRPDGQYVRYWSSNVPSGYGEKSVPRSKIAYVLFSRLETPGNLERITSAPLVDNYLASLLRSRSSISEAGARCGL
ncbi:MAG TPA: hypothetical protein VJR28_04805 [Chthoniobacterales bacterium]|nr:hypothetical protein [Chthoniobacterales bacterium]